MVHYCSHRLVRQLSALIFLPFLLLISCSEKGDPISPKPSIDLSGVWAGSWTGNDPVIGPVSGTWEADMTQPGYRVRASYRLDGDVDCANGTLEGAVGPNNVVSGTVSRPPCFQNEWILTGISLAERSATGAWTQPGTGAQGIFTGMQIAKPGGPRISFVSPPAGLPGTIVTVSGTGFGPAPSDNQLRFNTTPPAGFLTALTTKLVATAPSGFGNGPLSLQTPLGEAFSPIPFGLVVSSPLPAQSRSISLDYCRPVGVAFNPDGRKAYVACNYYLYMINTATNTLLFSPKYLMNNAESLVVHPAGRRLYVATGYSGITVLDAANLETIETIFGNAGGGADSNPQGIAITPDGRTLLFSNNSLGGAVTVMDLSNKTAVASVSDPSAVPLGIAVNPDGEHAYLAFSGTDEVKVFDLATLSVVDSVPTGSHPVGIAVTPDGKKVYVSCSQSNSVIVYNAAGATLASSAIITGFAEPQGLAVSPDGTRVFVANSTASYMPGSDTVGYINTQTDTLAGSFTTNAGTRPMGIAMSPDGMRAYVSHSNYSGAVGEIGGPLTLAVMKTGSGGGTVSSTTDGSIYCGTSCQARYPLDMVVILAATPASGSVFDGWGGNCNGGLVTSTTVTMDSSKICFANFRSTYDYSGGGGGGGGSYFACSITRIVAGSDLAPRIQSLRDFRDKYLMTNFAGRKFVRLYYHASPLLAEFIERHEKMREAARWMLRPVIFFAEHPGQILFLILLLCSVAFVLKMKALRRRSSALSRGVSKKITAIGSFFLLIILSCPFLAQSASAKEGFYTGILYTNTTIKGKSSDTVDKAYFDSLDPGQGITLQLGWGLNEYLAIEGSLFRTYHDTDFLGMANLQRQMFSGQILAIRLNLPIPNSRYTPYGYLGIGKYEIGDSGGTHYKGSGNELGLGLEVAIDPLVALTGGVARREITFDSGDLHLDKDTDATATSWNLGIVYHFP